jgi:pimeloyl-ACP methyl ester carboxylesterase
MLGVLLSDRTTDSSFAMELRRDLRAADARYRLPRGMVLVGHSMGGITTRAQASNSGGPASSTRFSARMSPMGAGRLPNAPILRDSLFFDRVENVRRLIFVCAPHRTGGPAGFFTTLVRLPQISPEPDAGIHPTSGLQRVRDADRRTAHYDESAVLLDRRGRARERFGLRATLTDPRSATGAGEQLLRSHKPPARQLRHSKNRAQ